jgi:hypothetical protein
MKHVRRHTPGTRDVALSRLASVNRWLIAGSVALTGVLAEVAAQAFPGKKLASANAASTRHASKRQPHPPEAPEQLHPPEQAPQPSGESSGSGAQPESPSGSAEPQEPATESSPQASEAPPATEAPQPEPAPAEEGPPVVSGAS